MMLPIMTIEKPVSIVCGIVLSCHCCLHRAGVVEAHRPGRGGSAVCGAGGTRVAASTCPTTTLLRVNATWRVAERGSSCFRATAVSTAQGSVVEAHRPGRGGSAVCGARDRVATSTRPTTTLLRVNAIWRKWMGRRRRVDSSSGTVGLPKLGLRLFVPLLYPPREERRRGAPPCRGGSAVCGARDAGGGVHSPNHHTAASQRDLAEVDGTSSAR